MYIIFYLNQSKKMKISNIHIGAQRRRPKVAPNAIFFLQKMVLCVILLAKNCTQQHFFDT